MPMAPLVAAWGRQWPKAGVGPLGAIQAGVPPVTFGTGVPLDISVELQKSAGYDTGFEDGVVPGAFSGSWEISTTRAHSGSYSLKSATIPDGGTSETVFMVPPQAQLMSLWYYVSSESGFDFFRIYTGTVTQALFKSGETGWQQIFIDVSKTAKLIFRYSKDGGGSAGDDAAYIDDIHVDAAWEEVAAPGYVLLSDGITIQRGVQNEQTGLTASQMQLTFKNQTKRFSPRNITGPYFGWLGPYNRVRVSVDPGSGMSRRYTGSIPDWSPTWASPNERFTSINAVGALHQLQQGSTPLQSALRTAITRAPKIKAYWALEEATNATAISSALPNGSDASYSGTVNFASDSSLPGADTAIALTASNSFIFPSFGVTYTHHWTAGCFMFIPAAGYTTGERVFFRMWANSGAIRVWDFLVDDAAGVGKVRVRGYSDTFTVAYDSGQFNMPRLSSGSYDMKGAWTYFRFMTKDDGTTITWLMDLFPALGGTGAFLSGTTPGVTGNLESVFVGALLAADLSGGSLSSVFFQDDYNADPALSAGRGFGPDLVSTEADAREEDAVERFIRMSQYANVPYRVLETVPDGQVMGRQQASTIEANIEETKETAEGLVYEDADDNMVLQSHTYTVNREVGLVLDYAHPTYGNQVYDIAPADDDLNRRNKWTITRSGGSTAIAELTTGSGSSQPPPFGIGLLDDSRTLNLGRDRQVPDHAWYRLARDSKDKPRFKKITIALHRNPELIAQFIKCGIGSRLTLANPPAELGPLTVDQTMIGITERITQFTWYVDMVTVPTQSVGVYDTLQHRYGCKETTTDEYVDTSETDITIGITDDCTWGHANGDYTVIIDQEEMLVTAVAAAIGSPGFYQQVLTVTRGTNGIVQEHREGAAVTLRDQMQYAL